MAVTKRVLLSLLSIAGIGWVLYALAPAYWQACELILALGGVAFLWRCLSSEKSDGTQSHFKRLPPPSSDSWLGNISADLSDPGLGELRPWDVEQSAVRLAKSRLTTANRPVVFGQNSVEQLANEMLNQAFRGSR